MRTFFLLAALASSLLATTSQAQTGAPLTGTVVDARTQAAVPYASLAVPGQAGGAITNAEGKFQLTLPPGTDSVRVQALGYAPLTVSAKLPPAASALVLRLQPQPYALQEVQVKALTPTSLLSQAVRHSTAQMASPVVLQTYYREFASYNGQIAKFADALVDYYMQGNPRKAHSPQVQVRVPESRTGQLALSKAEAEWAFSSPVNVEMPGMYYDVTAKSPYLDSTKFKNYRYTLLETPDGATEAPYYEVRCTPLTQELEYITQATVRIDRQTLTIQRIESEVPPQLQAYLPNISLLGVRLTFLQSRKRIDYQLYNGRLHPSFVRLQFQVDVTKGGVLRHYDFASDMLVRGLADAPASFAKSEQYSGSLYKRGTHYTRPYWREGNVVPATAAEEKVIETLVQAP